LKFSGVRGFPVRGAKSLFFETANKIRVLLHYFVFPAIGRLTKSYSAAWRAVPGGVDTA